MAPPVAVYVVAAVVGVAAIFAFKEYVYEPHIAPKLEAWAEDFLERRRAARNRRASAVSVRTPRRPRRSSSSTNTSDHNNDDQGNRGEGDGPLVLDDFSPDALELEALASREVDEWRNEVLRSQERTKDGLRRRRTDPFRDHFDGFETTSTTLDESFTSLTHTPLASTHVISNLSSPMTHSTVSLPATPTRHPRSSSQSTTTQDASTIFIAPPSPIHEALPTASLSSLNLASRSSVGTLDHLDITSTTPVAIPVPVRRSPPAEGVPHPLPLTPTYQHLAEDSPFGPLLPDTPRSSAEMYGKRPFSPITRVMGSASGTVSAGGPKGLSSSLDSVDSVRTLGGSVVPRKRSGLMYEVMTSGPDGGSDEGHLAHASTTTLTQAGPGPEMNGSVISSLSERYPAPPTPPVIVSPAPSSIDIFSAPSSPRSGRSEVMVHHDNISSGARSPPLPQTRPALQLPSGASNSHLASPTLSDASFLSPLPISRGVSESEADEFLSVASEESDWGGSPVVPRGAPVQDRAHNPFLTFDHVTHGRGLQDGDGSDEDSEESWSSARRH